MFSVDIDLFIWPVNWGQMNVIGQMTISCDGGKRWDWAFGQRVGQRSVAFDLMLDSERLWHFVWSENKSDKKNQNQRLQCFDLDCLKWVEPCWKGKEQATTNTVNNMRGVTSFLYIIDVVVLFQYNLRRVNMSYSSLLNLYMYKLQLHWAVGSVSSVFGSAVTLLLLYVSNIRKDLSGFRCIFQGR